MFTIDYCGYNTHNRDCDIIYRPNGSNSYLFLLILSPMIFYVDNDKIIAKPGACILYTPGVLQRYQAVKDFINSYIHFFSTDQEIKGYSFPLNKVFYPDNTHDINWYIKKIHEEHLIKPLHHQDMIHGLILQLMAAIDRSYSKSSHQIKADSSLLSSFQSLRLKMLSNCEEDWSIDRMCKMVNLEKSQFYSYYKIFFNTTPKAELLNARIDKAKFLLTNEALTINQIAHTAGFSDIYHFSRYFKKQSGYSPSQFRGLGPDLE
ncbi:MAG TPA: helix-turn-helix transcriptional regulator [Clostridiales bacterium]|jgi:AraC-like DNA-binding protein|nr:helix-turn-helix transcriptional regulator [Clostridiales bacterium]